ncbi:serine/threonine-protein kinase [Streptomyces sp. RFCAC02]|uniref:serine/threonine-protein kinase n=1 Tax=Streptomyces sp. RFCAC02 TaxID=2499143 RepID=UPI0010217813|nr:serine/threonine-protein kinase [Streptomyces sp. RFCAC02]
MTDDRDTAPRRLGEYVLERRLGGGGMGVVHLARTAGGRLLAVKVIRPEYAGDAGFRARFRREVAAARRVSGAFTAPVVDADPDGDPPWLATLYVPGGSLTDRVEDGGPLGTGEAARLGAQLAEALRDIHRCGLVHRDLKPGNVLLADDGVRLIDFGISRALADSRRLTEQGAVLGSPPFMAPEQLTGGGEVTAAADVFALGAVVAYAVTGRSPFDADGDPFAVAYRVVHEEPDLDAVPGVLRDTVARCLAKDPERRPPVADLLRLGTVARGGGGAVAPHWPDAAGPAAEERRSVPLPDTSPDGRTRRRRRWTAGVTALVALAVAGGGVWVVAPWDDGGTAARETQDAETRDEAAEFRPWELDLRDLGVLDAATGGFSCAPADDGLLCSAGGQLTVLLGPDGTERFRHEGPRDAYGGPTAVTDGGAVYARSDKGVVVLGPDGAERGEIDAPEAAGSLHLLAGGTLALRNGDSTLRFYRTDGLAPAGVWEAPGRYVTATAAHGDRLLVETRDTASGGAPELMLLDPAGRPLWPVPVTPPPETAGALELIGMDGGAAYFQELDPEVPVTTAVLRLALDGGGADAWTRTPLPVPAEPRGVVADGTVYASSLNGRVTAVDAAAGKVLWDRDTGVRVMSRPAARDGALYVSDGEGRLHRLPADGGTADRRGAAHPGTPGLGSDGSAPAPVVTDTGVAYVVTLGNTLYATPVDALAEEDAGGS